MVISLDETVLEIQAIEKARAWDRKSQRLHNFLDRVNHGAILSEDVLSAIKVFHNDLYSSLSSRRLKNLNGTKVRLYTDLTHLGLVADKDSSTDPKYATMRDMLEGRKNRAYSSRLDFTLEAITEINNDLRNTPDERTKEQAFNCAELVYRSLAKGYLHAKTKKDPNLQAKTLRLKREALLGLDEKQHNIILNNLLEGRYEGVSRISRERRTEMYFTAKLVLDVAREKGYEITSEQEEKLRSFAPKSLARQVSNSKLADLMQQAGIWNKDREIVRSLLDNFCDTQTLREYCSVEGYSQIIPQANFVTKLTIGHKLSRLFDLLDTKVRRKTKTSVLEERAFYEGKPKSGESETLSLLGQGVDNSILEQLGEGNKLKGLYTLIRKYGREQAMPLATAATQFTDVDQLRSYIFELETIRDSEDAAALVGRRTEIRFGENSLFPKYKAHKDVRGLDKVTLRDFRSFLPTRELNPIRNYTIVQARKINIAESSPQAVDPNSLLSMIGEGNVIQGYSALTSRYGIETGEQLATVASRFSKITEALDYLGEINESQRLLARKEVRSLVGGTYNMFNSNNQQNYMLLPKDGTALKYKTHPTIKLTKSFIRNFKSFLSDNIPVIQDSEPSFWQRTVQATAKLFGRARMSYAEPLTGYA